MVITGCVYVSAYGYRWLEGRRFWAHEPLTYTHAQGLKKLFYLLEGRTPSDADIEAFFHRQVTPCLVPKGKMGKVDLLSDCIKGMEPAYIAFSKLFQHLGDEQAFMEAVQKFANTYGTVKNIPIFFEEDGERVVLPGTPLEVWKEEVFEFWNCFELFRRLKNGEDLSRNILWYPDGVVFRYFADPVKFFRSSPRFSIGEIPIAERKEAQKLGFSAGDVCGPAEYYLRQKVAGVLRFSASIALDSENHFVVTFHETLPLIWFQFAQLVAGHRRLIHCRYCGLPLDATGRRKHLKGHQNCRKAHNVQEYRRRRLERALCESGAGNAEKAIQR